MSKIPQGEWNAIAARYAQGESISRIAQSYGCTPPAIHYILKRNRQRTAAQFEQPLNGRPQSRPMLAGEVGRRPAAPHTTGSTGPRGPEHQHSPSAPSESKASPGQPAELPAGRDRELAPLKLAESERQRPVFPLPQRSESPNRGRMSRLPAALDRELHGRAEAAIEAFRSSFDAALAEGSPDVRQRLRKAASDLMRVAARTTIVLDQLNARAERASAAAEDHLRNPRC